MFGLPVASFPVDNFALYNYPSAAGGLFVANTSVGGKTSVAIGSPDENTGVFIVAGQSLAGNHNGSLSSPASTAVQNLNPFTDVLYRMKDEMIGASGTGAGCFIPYLGDALISEGRFNRVIFVTPAIGGASVFNWSPAGQLNHRLIACIRRCQRLGLPISGILWCQGETDNQIGTTQAAYEASLRAVVASSRGAGYTGPWFIAKESIISSVASPTIVAAQTAVVNPSLGIYGGPNTDSLTGGTNRGDGTHLTNAGNAANASLWASVLNSHFG